MEKSIGMGGLSWLFRAVAGVIMLQTLYFKFTGAEESVYIFKTLGMEPWGRWGTGALELLAVALLVIPATVALGAALTVGLMSGAVLGHLTELGIEVQGDGGFLFQLALITLSSALILVYIHRRQLVEFVEAVRSHWASA